MPGKKPIKNTSSFSALSLAWELGYLITIPLIVFALSGRWLDKHFNTSPIFLLIGLFFSLLITSIFVYQKTIKMTAEFDDKK